MREIKDWTWIFFGGGARAKPPGIYIIDVPCQAFTSALPSWVNEKKSDVPVGALSTTDATVIQKRLFWRLGKPLFSPQVA